MNNNSEMSFEAFSILFKGNYVPKNKLKVLSIQPWMLAKHREFFDDGGTFDERYVKMDSIGGKPNWYFYNLDGRKFCWFEDEKGDAFYCDDNSLIKQFEYEFSIFNHVPFSDDVAKSFFILEKEHLLTKKQKEMIYLERNWRELKRIKTNGYAVRIRFNKFKKEHGLE